MLLGQGACDNDALDRLGHVQPRPADRRIERQHPVLEEPLHNRLAQMPGEVVPDQDQARRWQRLARRVPQPGLPACCGRLLGLGRRHRGQGCQDPGQFGREPGMKHGVRRDGYPFGSHLARRGTEQRQQLGRAIANVLMRPARWLPNRLPTLTRVRNGLVRSGFILAPDRDPGSLGRPVRLLDRPLFPRSGDRSPGRPPPGACAGPSRSDTRPDSSETSYRRLPTRARWSSRPPAAGRPGADGAPKVLNDQVAVPSRRRSGGRWAIAVIRARAAVS